MGKAIVISVDNLDEGLYYQQKTLIKKANNCKLIGIIMQALKNCSQHNQPVSYICFDPKCIQSSSQIMCNDCAQEHNKNHNNHRVVEYVMFKKHIHTFRNQIEYEQIKEIIRDEFIIFKADIIRQINQVEDSVMATISLQFGQHHEFQVFQGEIALLTKNQLFNKYILNSSSLNLIKEDMKLNNMHLLKEIRSLNEELNRVFESHKKQIHMPHIAKVFLFSDKNIHQNIEVLDNGTLVRCVGRQTQGILGHSQLALCRQPFSPMHTKVQFMIKEMSSRNRITVGACLPTHVKKNKFFRCWQLSHGTYSLFVNTFGQVKSNHHSNKLHSDITLKGWKINKGDIISVEIDFMREKIVFVKNNKLQHSMPVDIGIEKIYPFVAVSYLKDSVQVL